MPEEQRILGREKELAVLCRLVRDATPVALVGEAGIGRTAVAVEAARRSGQPPFLGNAFATLRLPLLPLRRALGLEALPRDTLAAADAVASRVGRGTLILDDAQWADAETLEVVCALAGRIPELAVVREGEPGTDALLARLEAAGFEVVPIPPLAPGDCEALLARLAPGLPPARHAEILQIADGNPLLLQELALAGETQPESVEMMIAARIKGLEPGALRALQVLAVLGRPATPELCTRLQIADRIGELERRRLVDVTSLVSLRHSLIGDWARRDMDACDHKAAHRLVAECVPSPGEAAEHLARAGDKDAALSRAKAAIASAACASEEVAWLRLAASVASGPEADSLKLRAAELLLSARQVEAARDLAESVQSEDPETRAAALYWTARAAGDQGDHKGAVAAVRAGLELTGDSKSVVALRLREESLRIPFQVEWDVAGALAQAADVVAGAAELGVFPHAALLWSSAAGALLGRDDWESPALRVLDHAAQTADAHLRFMAGVNLTFGYAVAGRLADGAALLEDLVAHAAALDERRWEAELQACRLAAYVCQGRYGEALELAPDVLLSRPSPTLAAVAHLCYGLTLTDLGRFDEARAFLARGVLAAEEDLVAPMLQTALADCEFWAGHPERAVGLLGPHEIALDGATPLLLLLYPTRHWAALEADLPPGPPLPLLPFPISRALHEETRAVGRRAGADDDCRNAGEAFDAARAAYGESSLTRGTLRCAWAAGEAMRRAGDLAEARTTLLQVEESVADVGIVPLLARVRRSLRLAGVHRRATHEVAEGLPLSEREVQVMRLIGNGLTYAQVGRRLAVSPRTVESHVKSARQKLGATNRSQALATMADLLLQDEAAAAGEG